MLGVILAGGRSRRFGQDKAVALLEGQRLIDRVIAVLRPQVDDVIVAGRMMSGATCVADRPVPDLGPLGGLNAGLWHARTMGFEWVVSAPCDAPFLPNDLVTRLFEPRVPRFAATSPVIGCWPVSLADALDEHLATCPDRSMRFWASVTGAQSVDIGEMPNINTPADLRAVTPKPA